MLSIKIDSSNQIASSIDSSKDSSKKYIKQVIDKKIFHHSITETNKIKDIFHKNKGRWTKEEHLLFIDAIFQYGNEWKKIQDYIKTRSTIQIRSHAQKFFTKLMEKLSITNEFYKKTENVDKTFNYIKECLPKSELITNEKEKLAKFWINLKRKRKSNKHLRKENSEYRSDSIKNHPEKIFIIEKDINNKNWSQKDNFDNIRLSHFSEKNIDNSLSEIIKLKRDLKPRDDKNKESKVLKNNKFNNIIHYSNSEFQSSPEPENQSMSRLNTHQIYIKRFYPTNMMLNELSNEFDFNNNKIFINELDFLKFENNCFHNMFEENSLNFNVYNSDIK